MRCRWWLRRLHMTRPSRRQRTATAWPCGCGERPRPTCEMLPSRSGNCLDPPTSRALAFCAIASRRAGASRRAHASSSSIVPVAAVSAYQRTRPPRTPVAPLLGQRARQDILAPCSVLFRPCSGHDPRRTPRFCDILGAAFSAYESFPYERDPQGLRLAQAHLSHEKFLDEARARVATLEEEIEVLRTAQLREASSGQTSVGEAKTSRGWFW